MSKLPDLPARLDLILDEVGVGAILKNLVTGRRAIVVDIEPKQGFPIAAMIREKWLEEGREEGPHKPEHYKFVMIGVEEKGEKKKKRKSKKQVQHCSGWRVSSAEMQNWVVMVLGTDWLLDEEEDTRTKFYA